MSQILEEVHSPKAPGRQHLHSQKENSSSYPQFFRVQAIPSGSGYLAPLFWTKKEHHFPIDVFTWWVFYQSYHEIQIHPFQKPNPAIFLRIYFLATLKLFPPKNLASFFQPPLCFASHWIPKFPTVTNGDAFVSRCWRLDPFTSLGISQMVWTMRLHRSSPWPWGKRKGGGGWLVGRLVKVGGCCLFLKTTWLATNVVHFYAIFLLSIVNDCFFLVDLFVRNFGRMG